MTVSRIPAFVIVRHGNTFATGEPLRRIGARTDLPLTGTGRVQAEALALHFAAQGWRFSRVLCSPLRRTRETAEAILASQPGPVPAMELAEFLREIDHGPDEDRPEEAVLRRIGKAALEAWDREAVAPPGWQVGREARLAGWTKLFADVPRDGALTLLVTSNGAARFALMADPALAAASRALPSLKLPTGGYGVLARGDGGRGALEVPLWGVRP